MLASAVFTLTSALLAQSAAAVMTLNYNPSFGSTENTGSTASAVLTFSDVAGDVFVDVQVTNTTPSPFTSTLVGIGLDLPDQFDLSTNITYDPLSSPFTKLFEDVNLQPYGPFEVGVRSAGSGNFIGGNPSDGLTAGESAEFRLKIDTLLSATQVENLFIDGYTDAPPLATAARFQNVNGGNSDKVLGGYDPEDRDDPGPSTGNAIPEPMTTTLGLLGLAGLALATQRRRG